MVWCFRSTATAPSTSLTMMSAHYPFSWTTRRLEVSPLSDLVTFAFCKIFVRIEGTVWWYSRSRLWLSNFVERFEVRRVTDPQTFLPKFIFFGEDSSEISISHVALKRVSRTKSWLISRFVVPDEFNLFGEKQINGRKKWIRWSQVLTRLTQRCEKCLKKLFAHLSGNQTEYFQSSQKSGRRLWL